MSDYRTQKCILHGLI